MCLAMPAQIVECLPDDMAKIDLGGVLKDVSVGLIDNVAVGDYVIVHVGYALSKIDPDEAKQTLALMASLGDSGAL